MTTREEILETVRRRRKRVIGLLISLKGHELSVADVAERLIISTTLAKLDLDELAIAEHVLEQLIAGLDEMKHEARRALAALRKMEQRGGEK